VASLRSLDGHQPEDEMKKSQKISTFLWFDANAEEAANFYVSVFNDARITDVTRYGSTGPGAEGSVMTIAFQLEGQEFVGLNGGPHFKFTEAISLVVKCESQAEIDALWSKLTAGGGKEVECGWLKDKFGLSWQIVPSAFFEMVKDPDRNRADRAMAAMMKMKKLDLARLEAAYRGD
jgi:predicted 3-demethylubiquinone-9 3-methyltransferase (glyoxalase superfamily)